MQTFILAVVFTTVAGLVLGIGLWLGREDAVGKRLNRLSSHTDTPENASGTGDDWQAKVAKVAAPIAWLATPQEGWESSNLRIRFMRAGLRGPGWPVIFFGAKTLLTLALPGLLLLYRGVIDRSSTAGALMFAVLALAGFGYYLPNLVLALLTRARQREVQEALPDAVDLMRVCVEAGLGLDAAMARAGEEMDLRSHALAEELNLVMLDLRVGSTREAALQNFALRTGVEDVATFVTILLQSEHFGTNVAESMRVLSETMREQRKVRAEERAAKIPLKLLFPLIFMIFPSLFVVLTGPAMISIYRVLLPTMGGAG